MNPSVLTVVVQRSLVATLRGHMRGGPGCIYTPWDLRTLWQDVGRTVPVANAGDPIACMDDMSGNGNHAKQADQAKRPLFGTDGTLRWVEFDGVDDCLQASLDLSAVGQLTACAAVTKPANPTTTVMLETSAGASTNNGAWNMLIGGGSVVCGSRGTTFASTSFAAAGSVSFIASMLADIAADSVEVRRDGLQRAVATGDQGAGPYGNLTLNIGARNNGSSAPLAGPLFGAVVFGGIDPAVTAAAERLLSRASAVALQ